MGDWVCVGGIVGVTEGTGECVGVSVEVAVRVGSSVKVGEGRFSSTLRVSGGAPSPIVDPGGGRVGSEWQEEASVKNKINPVKSSPFFMENLLQHVSKVIHTPEQLSAVE